MEFDDNSAPGDANDEENSEDGLWFDSAAGIDPDNPDPGCTHAWQYLSFTYEGEGLVCARCDQVWFEEQDAGWDAMLTVWQSAKLGLLHMQSRFDKLASIVEAMGNLGRCHFCDAWVSRDVLTKLGSRWCCPEHVGSQLVEQLPHDDGELDDALRWASNVLEMNPGDLYAVWLVEKAVLECSALSEADKLDGVAIGSLKVDLDSRLTAVLGLGSVCTVSDLGAGLAGFFELSAPASRTGRTVLLGLLARALWACDTPLINNNMVFADVLTAALPMHTRERATVILDLYRDELPADGVVSGGMADDLVEALVGRAADQFRALLNSTALPSAR